MTGNHQASFRTTKKVPWIWHLPLIFILVGLMGHQSLVANEGLVPLIRNVGVIPVAWVGKTSPMSDLSSFRSLSLSKFSKIVKASNRFQVINDQIVEANWNSPKGRRYLVDKFELDALIGMSISEESDMLVVTVRMYDMALRTYLKESDRLKKTWVYSVSQQRKELRLKELVYRLLNRYPIDVFVSSVQGSFVTLSGGKNQKIFEGDELTFYEISIAQVHPLDGSWLSYDSNLVGKAKVIESKSYSAIGRLTSLPYEGAIKIGAAAKVAHIASRRLFAASDNPRASSIEEPTILPLNKAPQQEQVNVPKDDTPPKPPQPPPIPVLKPKAEAETEAIVNSTPTPSEEPKETTDEESPGMLTIGAKELAENFKTGHAFGGLSVWSTSGTASASGITPYFEVWGDIDRNEATRLRVGSTLTVGPSGGGSFFSFGLSGSYTLVSQQPGLLFQFIDGIEYGALGELTASHVSGSPYGGHDAVTFGGLVRAYGRHHFIDSTQTLETELAFKLRLISLGQAGLAGNIANISGIFGYELEAASFIKGQKSQLELGGKISYQSNNYSVDTGSFSSKNLILSAAGRMRF